MIPLSKATEAKTYGKEFYNSYSNSVKNLKSNNKIKIISKNNNSQLKMNSTE